MKILVSYIGDLQTEFEKNNASKVLMKKEMNVKLEAAKKSGNEKEYNMIKKMRAMMFAFSGIDDYYISTNMLQQLENYEGVYLGTKNESYKKKVADWYVFLHALSPSAKSAVFVSDKLLALGEKELAMEVLELGLQEGSSAPGVEKTDIEACQNKLDSLK